MRILLSEAEHQRFQVICVLVSGMVSFCCSVIFVDFRLEATCSNILTPSHIQDPVHVTALQLHIRSLVGYLLKEMATAPYRIIGRLPSEGDGYSSISDHW